jgi:hypothetical protein
VLALSHGGIASATGACRVDRSRFPLDTPMPISTVYRLMWPQPKRPRAPAAASAPDLAAPAFAPTPAPPSERRAWILACSLGVLGVLVLVAALAGVLGSAPSAPGPPPVLVAAATPAPGVGAASTSGAASAAPILAHPTSAQQRADAGRFAGAPQVHITGRWVQAFYPIYATAQRTFGVNWLLLASIHMQETAFSTAPSTYRGLNFAHCCGGPMQFNVTNGPVSTWRLVRDSYRYGPRPAAYAHMTARHPSIYDDFDSIMAAARLLSADGAGDALDYSAWAAAYSYYGHDATGVTYADQVLARAIGWSQHGFCINCAAPAALIQAVHAAYGAPVLATLTVPPPAPARAALARVAHAGARVKAKS